MYGQCAVQFCILATFKDPEIEKYLLVLSWLIMSKAQIGTMNHLNVLYVRAKFCPMYLWRLRPTDGKTSQTLRVLSRTIRKSMITTCQILFQHDARIKEQLFSDSVSEFSEAKLK